MASMPTWHNDVASVGLQYTVEHIYYVRINRHGPVIIIICAPPPPESSLAY